MNIDNIKPDTSLYAHGSLERGVALLLCKQAQDKGIVVEARNCKRPGASWIRPYSKWEFSTPDADDYRVYVAPPPKPQVIEGFVHVHTDGSLGASHHFGGDKFGAYPTPEAARKDAYGARVFKATLTEVLP